MLEWDTSEINLLSYGIQIDENRIILPSNADEFYEDFENVYYFKFLGQSLGAFTDRGLFANEYSKGILTQINDGAFMLKSSLPHEQLNQRKVMKISRYPVCNNEENIKTVVFNGTELFVVPYYSMPPENCRNFFPDFSWQKQSCSESYDEIQAGIPLISTFDDGDFLVGLSDSRSTENSTLYNFIVDECYGFPIYRHCYSAISSPSKYTFCNSAEISLNLKEVEGIILFGNVQEGIGNTSFIPFGLGTVVSNNQAIIPSSVFDLFEDYKIYGNGKKFKLAYMINRKVKIFEGGDYDRISTGIKMLKLVKFNEAIFKDIQKAKFDGLEMNLEEAESFKFKDERLEIRKSKRNVLSENEKFLVGAPIFKNGLIVGFQNEYSRVSILILKNFLQQKVPSLSFEASTTTTTKTSNEL
uniref:Peptidase A1 domain-containing protein n=1 Tax=Panagrolaimus sp. PS1159 TaxID=55785 RepID=A0AC35FZY6_9BILA